MTPCIEWARFVGSNGYGRRWSRLRKKMSSAHRVAWEEAHGPIPQGRCVLHTCDNRRCVNLDHLYLGSMSDNSQDMVRRKRRRWDGEHSPAARLTQNEVDAIRTSNASGTELGRQYGISRQHANAIKRGTTWATPST